mgnify:CR=1 FL=1
MLPCVFLPRGADREVDIGVQIAPGAQPGPDDECPICFELLSNDSGNSGPEQPYWRRACAANHAYHQGCLRQHLVYGPSVQQVNRQCPECRRPMPEELRTELLIKHANLQHQKDFEETEKQRLRTLEAERARRRRRRFLRLARNQDERRRRMETDPFLRAMYEAGREESRRRGWSSRN